ncbi:MAG TPA: crossover junction endodeoxyribonuclease RuvC [Candidatus Latescibacteria bacterium]|nr:MAG: Crossover junction endodeoxyribonuclease RuvC [Candidatus Latescibacteria bacterium ADurb.Bin168]HPU84839.1 crossover junction endodeoxyribonuclease RuvC [Candidatus Latescibacterota bacterium]
MTAQRVLGVDPGTIVCGYGIIDVAGSRYTYVTSGVIRPVRNAPMPDRLCTVFRGIASLIEEYRPSVLAVEEAFYGDNPKTAIKLGQARGVILVQGVLAGMQVSEFSPRFIKQAVVGVGSATKEQIQYMVARILKLPSPPQPTDAADALATALCFAVQPHIKLADDRPLTRAQRQMKALGIL